MIRQEFNVEHYWKVIVFWNIDYNLFYIIERELIYIGTSGKTIKKMYRKMSSGKAKAVTFNSYEKHISIVIFNYHSSKADYVNSIVHEIEHVKQAMLEAYRVEDRGEPPAYTIGYLAAKMYKVFANIICSKCY